MMSYVVLPSLIFAFQMEPDDTSRGESHSLNSPNPVGIGITYDLCIIDGGLRSRHRHEEDNFE